MEKLRVGAVGCGRGMNVAAIFAKYDCDVVAYCDDNPKRNPFVDELGATAKRYDNFDEFLDHGLDIVVLGNFFHEHAPLAIKCLERGIHVYCECLSNGTMAEGVELIRAAEKSDAIYFMADNYPGMLACQEIKRVCKGGSLGKILYAEGEYNHPYAPDDVDFLKSCFYYPKHWRNYIPSTYYVTHSLAPLMAAVGATPKIVTAFSAFSPIPDNNPNFRHTGDIHASISTFNDDGSIYRVCAWGGLGAGHISYRVGGVNGQIENVRGFGEKIMLRYNGWSVPEGMKDVNFYMPSWNLDDEDKIDLSGHGGGDDITVRAMLRCVREGKQPELPFDVHSGVAMSSVAILGWRSVLEGGKPYEIPDFRKEEWCKLYENDRLTPFYGSDGSEPTLPCSTHPDYAPTETQKRLFKELVTDQGFGRDE